jgi:hypothetical protein
VGLSRTVSYSHFLQQLSKATSAVWDEVGFFLGHGACFVVLAVCLHRFVGCDWSYRIVEATAWGSDMWRGDSACGAEQDGQLQPLPAAAEQGHQRSLG